MTVWSIGSPSGFTGRLFHTITCAQSRRDSHTANHIMCGVWNRQWGDPLGNKPGHQASRYLPWWKWHQKQYMTWDFIISTSGIQGDFWCINHGCRQDNSWKNQLVTNFFHLHYKILSNALGLFVVCKRLARRDREGVNWPLWRLGHVGKIDLWSKFGDPSLNS